MKTEAAILEEESLHKDHIIQVLQHESKVYKFERNVMANMNVDLDQRSENQRKVETSKGDLVESQVRDFKTENRSKRRDRKSVV